MMVFGTEASVAEGSFCLPEEGALHALRLEREGDDFVLEDDPLRGKVKWEIRSPRELTS
ncbi:MAG: hypothetical protein M3309_13905 [Actinomycetota bacterium]|nr:hypothetical protein [Actinomycetota bacterium]